MVDYTTDKQLTVDYTRLRIIIFSESGVFRAESQYLVILNSLLENGAHSTAPESGLGFLGDQVPEAEMALRGALRGSSVGREWCRP